MKSFINNNPAYGESGPFEAESAESLADEMHEMIKIWAHEKLSTEEYDMVPYKKIEAEIRAEFISGLTEI